jgi:periplasmic protein CpxP/Spy
MKHLRTMMMLCACLFALAVFAQQNPPAKEGGEHQRGGHMSHEMPSAEDHLKELTSRLNLTADQQAKIKPILDEHLQQMQDLRKDTSLSKTDSHAKMEAIHNSLHSKIREILNDDQKTKFDAMVKEHGAHEAGEHQHHSDKH